MKPSDELKELIPDVFCGMEINLKIRAVKSLLEMIFSDDNEGYMFGAAIAVHDEPNDSCRVASGCVIESNRLNSMSILSAFDNSIKDGLNENGIFGMLEEHKQCVTKMEKTS